MSRLSERRRVVHVPAVKLTHAPRPAPVSRVSPGPAASPQPVGGPQLRGLRHLRPSTFKEKPTTIAVHVALEGHPLTAGHPVYDAYIGRPDPLANQSQNSITYGDLPEEAEFRTRPCACGCGETTDRDFAPGHELRAIQARIRQHFGGSALALIQWIDKTREQPAS